MKKILLFILLTSGFYVSGQTSFNYKNDLKKILEKTKDKKDELSYDRLLKRFRSNDTLTDYRACHEENV